MQGHTAPCGWSQRQHQGPVPASLTWWARRETSWWSGTSSSKLAVQLSFFWEVLRQSFSMLFLSFDIIGECPLATDARRLTNIKRLPNYKQHITMGLLKGSDFPEVVLSKQQEDWQDNLGSEFMTCSILTRPEVGIRLLSNDVTCWEVMFSCSEGVCKVVLQFTKTAMKISGGEAQSSNLKSKIEAFSRVKFEMDDSIFAYIHVLCCTLRLSLKIQLLTWGRALNQKLKI